VFTRNSHVHSDEGALDSGRINFVEGFEISVNSLSCGENVDLGSLDLPGTGSTSTFWHNCTEVFIFVRDGSVNTFPVATEKIGGLDEVLSEDFVHDLLSLLVLFPCNLKFTIELLVISLVGISDSLGGRFELVSEFFPLLWGIVHPVGSTSSISEALFHSWFVLLSHSSEEPGVKAFGDLGLILWLFAEILVGWGKGLLSF